MSWINNNTVSFEGDNLDEKLKTDELVDDNSSKFIEQNKELEKIKEEADLKKEEDLEQATKLSKEIKWECIYDKKEIIEDNRASMWEILKSLSKDKRIKILESIYLWFKEDGTWKTIFKIEDIKQTDDWKNIDMLLEWSFELNWEKLTFSHTFWYFEDFYDRRLSNKEFVVRMLQSYEEGYKPSLLSRLKSSIINRFKEEINTWRDFY